MTFPITAREFDRLPEHDPLRDERRADPCPDCDGTGCLCLRARDWQSIDQGCGRGCPRCGLRSCNPPALFPTTGDV